VARISSKKAHAITANAEDVVIAADTIVVVENRILGKPRTPQEAAQMLRLLSGRDHQVMTGVTVRFGQQEAVFTEITALHFRDLTDGEILRYVQTGEPMDKAGAYGIQGGAALFCEKISGDYYNVMGLPVCRLGQVLKALVPQIMGELL
jgi:septum formation protein